MASTGVGYKIGAAVVLFLLTLGFAYLPRLLQKFTKNRRILSIANCLAGGIFLAACLIHILPEANSSWSKKDEHEEEVHTDGVATSADVKSKHEEKEEFPWVYFIAMVTVWAILLIDRILLPGHHHPHSDPEGVENQANHNHDHPHHHHEHEHEHDHDHARETLNNQQNQPAVEGPNSRNPETEIIALPQETTENAREVPIPAVPKKKFSLGPYAMLVAIGVHAFFEGTALGLMDEFAGFVGFFFAVVFHKWAESLSVGISFMKSKASRLATAIAVTIFSLLTSIGVLIGMWFSDSSPKVKGSLLAISGGTFLYISLVEVTAEEFSTKHNKYWKFFAYLLGSGIMTFIWYIENLNEGHSH